MVPRAHRSVWQSCARGAAAMRKRSLQPTRVTPDPRPRQKQQTSARGFPLQTRLREVPPGRGREEAAVSEAIERLISRGRRTVRSRSCWTRVALHMCTCTSPPPKKRVSLKSEIYWQDTQTTHERLCAARHSYSSSLPCTCSHAPSFGLYTGRLCVCTRPAGINPRRRSKLMLPSLCVFA
jgi:hypothetical protein